MYERFESHGTRRGCYWMAVPIRWLHASASSTDWFFFFLKLSLHFCVMGSPKKHDFGARQCRTRHKYWGRRQNTLQKATEKDDAHDGPMAARPTVTWLWCCVICALKSQIGQITVLEGSSSFLCFVHKFLFIVAKFRAMALALPGIQTSQTFKLYFLSFEFMVTSHVLSAAFCELRIVLY